MDSWQDVVACMQARDAEITDDACELVWPIEGVAIVQRVRPVAAHGRGWLVITAALADRFAAAADALAYNATLAIGALAIEDGELVVRHALALPADERALDEALEAIALEAAFVRLGARDDVRPNPFAHLVE